MENVNPWVLLVAGALLGWLGGWLMELLFFRRDAATSSTEQIGLLTTQLTSCESELQNLRLTAPARPSADVTAYEAQIAALQTQNATLEAELKRLRVAPIAAAAATASVADWGVKTASVPILAELPVAPDDLETLEGIGPVIAVRLRDAGVTNYARLANLTPAWLDDMLRIPAWRRPAYDEWIAQARLAAAGDDAALAVLQAQLNSRQGDNLLLIYGVGPTTADALRAAGVTSFAALAEADPDRLRVIAIEAGIPNADVDAWMREAGLRAAGKRIARSPHLREVATMMSCPQDLARVRGIGAVLESKLYAAGIGTFWELAGLSDEELGRILEADEIPDISLSSIKSSARHLAEDTGTTGLAWDGTPPDDLELLAGIGETYERRLVEGGICTYRALAAATVEELEAIIKPQGSARPDYASWIAQAKARAD